MLIPWPHYSFLYLWCNPWTPPHPHPTAVKRTNRRVFIWNIFWAPMPFVYSTTHTEPVGRRQIQDQSQRGWCGLQSCLKTTPHPHPHPPSATRRPWQGHSQPGHDFTLGTDLAWTFSCVTVTQSISDWKRHRAANEGRQVKSAVCCWCVCFVLLCNRLVSRFPASHFLPLGSGLLGRDEDRPRSAQTYIWEVTHV